jgi:hypothetical protein
LFRRLGRLHLRPRRARVAGNVPTDQFVEQSKRTGEVADDSRYSAPDNLLHLPKEVIRIGTYGVWYHWGEATSSDQDSPNDMNTKA